MEPRVLESAVVVGFYSYICFYWNQNFLEETKHFKILGYSICVMLLISLHQIVPIIHSRAAEKTEPSPLDQIYRLKSDPGLWCSLLIPLALTTNLLLQPDVDCTPVILAHVIVVLVLVRFNPSSVTQITCAGLLYWFREDFVSKGRPEQVVLAGLCVMAYIALGCIPQAFSGSFTEGELAICVQVLFVPLYPILVISWKAFQKGVSSITLPPSLSIALMAYVGVLVGTVLVCGIRVNNGWVRFLVSYGLAAVCALLPLAVKLYGTPLPYRELLLFLTQSQDRVLLILGWSLLVFLSLMIALANQKRKLSKQGSTRLRKVFHVLTLGVFVSGLIYDASLLFSASWVAMGVMIIVETLRLLNVSLLGPLLQRCYSVFLGPQDAGRLVLTPVYLLAGMSLPLWIHTFQWCDFSDVLPLFAGVMSVGVGDTMASIVGSALGRHKILGGHKSVEGTAASIIFQLIFIFILNRTSDGQI
ncbi:uncharacterized protein LOC111127757 isoform X2 [Crassostrea virginica]